MELRRLVLAEELLGLPAVVEKLAEAQGRTEARVSDLAGQVQTLAEAQQRTEAQLADLAGQVSALVEAQERTARQIRALAEAQERTEARVSDLVGQVRVLAETQGRTEARLADLAEAQRQTQQHVGALRGTDREQLYRERASAYFGRLLRRVRVVAAAELDDLLDEGMTSGALDEESVQDVRWADLIVGGRRPGDDRDTFLVVEVSVAIDPDDVERAACRAAVLGRLRPTLAVVAGDRLTPAAEALAEARGVWQMLDGRVVPPSSAA